MQLSINFSKVAGNTRYDWNYKCFGSCFISEWCISICEDIPDKNKKTNYRVFTVGLNNPDKSKYAEFMIEKRELANKIIEIMDKL